MGIRSQGNPTSTYKAVWEKTGLGAWAAPPNPLATPGMTASGGIISEYMANGNAYRSHIFTVSGVFASNFVITALGQGHQEIDCLLVGGGGGGGLDMNVPSPGGAGGGGGGELVYREAVEVPGTGTYPITVGTGGKGGGWWSNPSNGPLLHGQEAGTSQINGNPYPMNAIGGGGGGAYGANSPAPANGDNGNGTTIQNATSGGGAGGGAVQGSTIQPGGGAPGHPGGIDIQTPDGTTGWGDAGGGAPGSPNTAGGGGGAAGAGVNGTPTAFGNGGVGARYTIATGSAEYYSGGGGAGGGNANTGGTGGSGGGGNGTWIPTSNPSVIGTNGIPGTGGGGGGAGKGAPALYPAARGGAGTIGSGFQGGHGIICIRYKIASAQQGGTAKATGGAISFYNSKTIHTFYRSGTFTTPGSFSETCEYVVLAGGGSGGAGYAGGGGAGGYRTGTTPVGSSLNLTVTVGDGGKAAARCNNYVGSGDQGQPSSVNFPAATITSTGGGFGGHNWSPGSGYGSPNGSAGGPGGSGGGASFPPGGGGAGNAGGPGEGNNGGNGVNAGGYDNAGGGGGGAGGAGEQGTSGNGGNGGIGVQLPATFRNPVSSIGFPGPGGGAFWVAGGGGGGTRSSPGARGQGGTGPTNVNPLQYGYCGAGHGAGNPHGPTESVAADDARANSGSGGGGCGGGGSNDNWTGNNPSGCGGSGLILIAYPT